MGLMDVGGWFTISLDMTRARHLKNFDFRRLPKASDEMDHNPISQKFWHHKLQVDEPLLLTSFILSMPLFFPCLFDKFFFFGGSFIGKSLTGSYCLYVICKKKPPNRVREVGNLEELGSKRESADSLPQQCGVGWHQKAVWKLGICDPTWRRRHGGFVNVHEYLFQWLF